MFQPMHIMHDDVDIISSFFGILSIALIGCRSIQLSPEAISFLVQLKHGPIITVQWSSMTDSKSFRTRAGLLNMAQDWQLKVD